MSDHIAKIVWSRSEDEGYLDHEYSRAHDWVFDGGLTVPASSSPQVVPLPFSVASNVDPEEAFVASLASCHMLFFLSIAAKRRFVVDEYIDNAVGMMAKNAAGKLAMTKVILRPAVKFAGAKAPTRDQLEKMHHSSHAQCFIANSVTTEVVTEIVT